MSKLLILCFLFITFSGLAQTDDFKYRQEIFEVKGQWNRIVLSEESYSKIEPDGSDLRIIGLNGEDTLSIPFLLKTGKELSIPESRIFKIINRTTKENRYFYTLRTGQNENNSNSINSIELDFERENFDWRVRLEGSNDQKEWFTILEDYRIVSIKNALTDYSFSRLAFSSIEYDYFRISLESDKDPLLNQATLLEDIGKNDIYQEYNFSFTETQDDTPDNRSMITIDLMQDVPVSKIWYEVDANYDYFRAVKTEILVDSVETEKGWKRNYRSFPNNAVISSLEEPFIEIPNILTSGIRLTIYHKDDEPLDLTLKKIEGIPYKLTARFDQKVYPCFLLMGNSRISKPPF